MTTLEKIQKAKALVEQALDDRPEATTLYLLHTANLDLDEAAAAHADATAAIGAK